MKKPFIGVYNPSIILTYVGAFAAISGMGLLLSEYEHVGCAHALKWPMILLVIAGVCDLFDGRIARMCKRTDLEKQFGIQLDSLADTVSFVAYPACMLLFVTRADALGIAIACFYTFAGIMRLGWFNVTTETNRGIYYGLPVTFAAALFPILHVIWSLFSLSYQAVAFKIAFAVVGLCFILNFKLKKPGLIGAICFVLLGIATVTALILL